MATESAPAYPWYQVASGADFTQGDILIGCPILTPNADDVLIRAVAGEEGLSLEIPVKKATLIVMIQACDIAYQKVDSIVLCPVWPLEEYSKDASGAPHLASTAAREELRKGNFPPFHLLNSDADFKLELQIVDFRELYSLPTKVVALVAEKAGKRPRLLSPYREQLAQSFARYFMRVGLPIDIPKFTK